MISFLLPFLPFMMISHCMSDYRPYLYVCKVHNEARNMLNNAYCKFFTPDDSTVGKNIITICYTKDINARKLRSASTRVLRAYDSLRNDFTIGNDFISNALIKFLVVKLVF